MYPVPRRLVSRPFPAVLPMQDRLLLCGQRIRENDENSGIDG